jgi:SAM-dependent methyltransferase
MPLRRKLRMIRRRLYGMRSYIPGLRHRHRLEALVGPLGYWKHLQCYQFRAVTELGLQEHDTLLDLGCGPLQGGIAFIRYLHPGRYFGVDQKPAALNAARDELSRQKLWTKKPTLILSSEFGDDQLGDAQFDFIWLSQVLYYFDEPTLHRLLALAGRRLHPGGIIAGDILGPHSDASFLHARHPRPPVHTAESIGHVAQAHGFHVTTVGTLREFGYPRQLNLGNNLLLKMNRLKI